MTLSCDKLTDLISDIQQIHRGEDMRNKTKIFSILPLLTLK